MNPKNIYLTAIICSLQTIAIAQTGEKAIYKSGAYSIYNNRIEQGNFKATVLSSGEMSSNYRSPEADKYSPCCSVQIQHQPAPHDLGRGRLGIV